MDLVNGIDLELLLEDLAYTKRRVSELEDNQETIVKFLSRSFPKKANQLKRILPAPEEQKSRTEPKNAYSVFGQEDDGLTTTRAISRCFASKPVSSDPINFNSGISWPKVKHGVPESLRG